MARREPFSFWQSYADLGMGLMAVFALILLILLYNANENKDDLKKQRQEFAEELLALLEEGSTVVKQQDRLRELLSHMFSVRDCPIRLDDQGQLTLKQGAAQLYKEGDVRVSKAAQAALDKCATNFFLLAKCLGTSKAARDACVAGIGASGAKRYSSELAELRRGIQALVLQGSTDRNPYKSRYIQDIVGDKGYDLQLSRVTKTFVGNAYLGSERARQALGHLLHRVRSKSKGDADRHDPEAPLEVLISRLRIESPSFGLYQAGPTPLRRKKPNSNEPECTFPKPGQSLEKIDDAKISCEAARRLSLLLRWKKSALRRPFNVFRCRLCRLLRKPDSPFYRGLIEAGKDPEVQRKAICSDYARRCGPSRTKGGVR
jgi:hypothetical protein